nr:amidohydrolase [Gemmatimonadota bacterium]NIR77422.1 amidohydrolase [Gemmatimonadota bacterium]NIT85943.1 amidohydrolase [Gemmatimonadota bacterium]NIU29763.1 amidohydrolase [Gemmatimonadota bacterium]NIV60172.1 amidohydrolase family protein [Gemmatimonadota bacterium]
GAPEDAPTGIAIRDGRVQAVGSAEEIDALAGPETRRIELQGRRVLPGFMDSHTHFIDGGFELSAVQLRDASTPEEFARRIGAFAEEHPGEWITGGQWDHQLWGGELPRRDWIDPVTGETPVYVTRLDGHMGLANSAALAAAGIDADTESPPGGEIVRYPDGRPTGILRDAAQALVRDSIPPPSDEEVDRALQAAAERAVSLGVTHVVDVGSDRSSWRSLEAYRRAHERGQLPLRVYAAVPLSDWERMAEYVDDEGRGDDRLWWGGLKAYVDGSLGSSTAWFYEPYVGEPDNTGLVVTDTADLRSWIASADSAGLHVMVHAIGTRANDWLLDAFAQARERNGPRDRRFRIEHAQHLTDDAIRRIAEEEVIASMQPYHAIDDGRWAESRIGHRRALGTYAFRSLVEAGAILAFGSDWTVAPLDPLQGVYAAVTRRTIDGANPEAWIPEQKISLQETLRAYTGGVAYASYREEDLGRLEPGFRADLVVLSDDLFMVEPGEIPGVEVELTMVDGEVVFE